MSNEHRKGCERCDTSGGRETYANQVAMPIGGKTVCIDWCIHQIVAALNAGGVRTVACCCGHGRMPGRIDLEDGRVLTVGLPNIALHPLESIDTAPKNGTEILVWRKDYGFLLARWTCCDAFMTDRELDESDLDDEALFAEDWFYADFVSGGRLEGVETPTHWMPLPPPPDPEA